MSTKSICNIVGFLWADVLPFLCYIFTCFAAKNHNLKMECLEQHHRFNWNYCNKQHVYKTYFCCESNRQKQQQQQQKLYVYKWIIRGTEKQFPRIFGHILTDLKRNEMKQNEIYIYKIISINSFMCVFEQLFTVEQKHSGDVWLRQISYEFFFHLLIIIMIIILRRRLILSFTHCTHTHIDMPLTIC